MRLEKKFLEITLNLIKQMKDDAEASVSIEVAMSLVYTIEELQQQLKQYDQDRTAAQQLWGEECEEHIKLQQENEQLKAQAARHRTIISRAIIALKSASEDLYRHIIADAKQAISDTPADYHNPADVALLRSQEQLIKQYCKDIVGYLVALAKVREALNSMSFRSSLGSDEETIREAIAAIDKAIGGKEDGK